MQQAVNKILKFYFPTINNHDLEMIYSIIENHDNPDAYLKEKIDILIQNKSTIRSPIGFLIAALKGDYKDNFAGLNKTLKRLADEENQELMKLGRKL